ncbi:protein kinase domain protein [Ichthyophthirius multifiliis]|uniref:Protein kinase domain protein n=1 Tax=Ichthyophthirius multifiliis TaxID=5932 RepID=G0QJZ5_ICHMU|nr:protein kinase domain protein [Ichthyophthirius multifiliis]EGR34455.1 protein kinase domain protein [Ichthyophthirius multifiliis]|eukprot:XP_004039759.1 protein kinase domain protein [Ichthyophthirius multifiliis]
MKKISNKIKNLQTILNPLYFKSKYKKNEERVVQGQDLIDGKLIAIKTVFKNEESGIDILQELVPGGSIGFLLESFHKFEIKLAIYFLKQIIQALYILHSNKIVHGNLKPNNILVDNYGYIKLTDINIFKNINYLKSYWSAPEVIIILKYIYYNNEKNKLLNEDKLLFSSDIWSAGIIFLQMINGYHPWQQGKDFLTIETIKKKFQNKVPFYLPKNISNEMALFINFMISKNPDSRLSAYELLKQSFLNEEFSRNDNYQNLNLLRRLIVIRYTIIIIKTLEKALSKNNFYTKIPKESTRIFELQFRRQQLILKFFKLVKDFQILIDL